MRVTLSLALMAIGTYALRAGGLWLMVRWTPPRFIERALRHTPGALLAALVAPAVLRGGLPTVVASVVTAAVALRTRSFLGAIVAGTLAVWLLRHLTA